MTRETRWRAFWTLTLTTAMLLVVPVAGAASQSGEETHCVIEVIGEKADGEFVTAPEVCFDTFSESIAHASGGTVVLDSSTPGSAALTNGGIASVLSTFTLGIHYDGYNGTGSSRTVVGSSCSGGWWNAGSFANKTSSSYHGCGKLVHYDYSNMQGARYTTTGAGTTKNLYGFNNRTNSVQYLP